MSKNLRLRSVVLFVVLVFSSAVGVFPIVAPRLGIAHPVWLLEKQLKLGLDLRGGVHLVLGVQVPSQTPPAEKQTIVNEVIQIIERRVNELGVAESLIASQANGDEILVQLPGMTDI